MIYHIASVASWEEQLEAPDYYPAEFEKDGFIHLCYADQLAGVYQRYYKGREDLLLLEVDEKKLEAPLRLEPSTGGALFPHLYGRINKPAIMTCAPYRGI